MANLAPLTPRQRLFGMIAASIADLDGATRLFGEECYWRWHHTATHNLPFGILSAVVLTALSARSRRGWPMLFAFYLALFHLHLVLDYYGSGPGWHIHYFWPLGYFWPTATWIWRNPNAWEFRSWQNMVALLIFFAWTVAIAMAKRRTPLELLYPSLDRQLVGIPKPATQPQEVLNSPGRPVTRILP